MTTKKNNDNKNVVERYYFSFDDFKGAERTILTQEHLKRYGAIRRFCYGKVLDLACGCGYGTNMISVNPDVEHVDGIDVDKGAIEWAKNNFQNEKIAYKNEKADSVNGEYDTLVCIETIEHIKNKKVIPELVKRCNIKNIIVSFPDKKTTHYNKHHFHDFVEQDIIDLFSEHITYHVSHFMDSTIVFLIKAPKNAPHELFRNVRDLR